MYLRALLALETNEIGMRARTGLQAKAALHGSIHLDMPSSFAVARPRFGGRDDSPKTLTP